MSSRADTPQSDDHPVAYDDHTGFFSYRVYISVPSVTREMLIPFLQHPDAGDDSGILTETHLGATTQTLIRYHRDNTPITRDSDIHPKLFFIVDSDDLHERGIMLVGLDEYHGFDDAVRGPIADKRDELLSLSITNDDWWTSKRIHIDDHPKATPMKWFSVYNLQSDEDLFGKAFEALNEGLYDVHVRDDDEDEVMSVDSGVEMNDDVSDYEDTSAMDGDESPSDEAMDGWGEGEHADGDEVIPDEEEEEEEEEVVLPEDFDHFYKAVHPKEQSVDEVLANHAAYARENTKDPCFLVIVDEDYKDQGPLIVRLSPERDSFRCQGPVAGELLRWIFISFMSWDEVKAFAQSQQSPGMGESGEPAVNEGSVVTTAVSVP